MITQRKRIFDFFVEKLNENTQGVTFSGNFVFKFYNQQQGVSDFEIISKNEDTLDFESTEIVPVINAQSIEIPFVEQNERSDFEQEYYIALKIENRINEETNQQLLEFDDSDPKYLAMIETVNTLKTLLSFNYDGYKYTIKVKEPQVIQTFKYNGNYYTLFSIGMNMTTLKDGFYGNEMKFYLCPVNDAITSTDLLDTADADFIVGKQTVVFNNIDFTATDQQTQVNSRNFQAQLTINYRGGGFDPDALLFNELMAQDTDLIDKKYRFRASQNGANYDKIVVITSINGNFRNNSVQQITFQLERA